MSRHHIASVSWGKDSLAMLHMLIDNDCPLDEVMFFDTGMEFPAVYAERDRVLPTLRELGIKYTELRPKNPMWWSMFCRPVKEKEPPKPIEKLNLFNQLFRRAGLLPSGVHYGYGWCGDSCRWGTSEKLRALDRYAKERDACVYVGIAADETPRLERKHEPYKRHPLVEAGWTEDDCLRYCYSYGHAWEQDGVRLYDILDRVSCWCCRNKNQKELRAIHDHLPAYWERLLALEAVLGQMKGKTLHQIAGEADA